MVTLSKPTAQRADVTIWLQALDGTWEACGTSRMIGVVPESLVCDSDAWGSKTASFDLRRPVFALWPDIAAFAPCMIEIGGVLRWRGRTGDTPIRDGVDPVINVQCEGSQVRLDDDVYQPLYVHSSLSDWRDARSFLHAPLSSFVASGQVQAGDGVITLTWASGTAVPAGSPRCGVALDLGPNCTAAKIVIDFDSSNNDGTNSVLVVTTSTDDSLADGEVAATFNNVGASSALTLTPRTPTRYLKIVLQNQSARTLAADIWFRLKAIRVFGSTAYESGGASALTADVPIKDALSQATMLLSPDRSGITRPSFLIPDLAPDEERTPREIAEGMNAFHNWMLKLDVNDRPVFRPRPSAPLLEIGNWSGATLVDANGSSGANIYNRCIVRAAGSDGSPVVVTRWDQTLAQTPSLAAAQVANPSFDVDASGWTQLIGVLSRSTSDFLTGPACGRMDLARGLSQITTTLTGLDAGRLYRLQASVRTLAGNDTCRATLNVVAVPSVTIGTATLTTSGSGQWEQLNCAFTAPQDGAVKVDLIRKPNGTGPIIDTLLIDEVRLYAGGSTVVDRRRFRHTFVLKPSFKITTAVGQQLADTFLAAHRTTPYRGTCRITPGGARYVLGGSSPHPSALLSMTQELAHLAHRIDPDTGGVGRTATMAMVKYTHRDQAADVDLDDPRSNLDAFMARMAVVRGAGS